MNKRSFLLLAVFCCLAQGPFLNPLDATDASGAISLLQQNGAQSYTSHCSSQVISDYAKLVSHQLQDKTNFRLQRDYISTMSLEDIQKELDIFGVSGISASNISFEDLIKLDRPSIVQIRIEKKPYFIALERATNEWVRIIDGASIRIMPVEKFKAAFSGIAIYAAPNPNLVSQTPRFTSDCYLANLGSCIEDEVLQSDFHIKNTGTEPLTVKCISAPKDCSISGNLDKKVLKAGKSANFMVSFVVSKAAAEALQPIKKDIVLQTNDPLRPTIYLTFVSKAVKSLRDADESVKLDSILDDIANGNKAVSVSSAGGCCGSSTNNASNSVAAAPPLNMWVSLEDVFYNAESKLRWEPKAGLVTVSTDLLQAKVWVGRETAVVNGRVIRLQKPARYVNGKVEVPLSFILTAERCYNKKSHYRDIGIVSRIDTSCQKCHDNAAK